MIDIDNTQQLLACHIHVWFETETDQDIIWERLDNILASPFGKQVVQGGKLLPGGLTLVAQNIRRQVIELCLAKGDLGIVDTEMPDIVAYTLVALL